MQSPAALAALREAGLRGVPVVRCGDAFRYGQDLAQVAELVGVPHRAAPQLSRNALIERWQAVLRAAARFVAQIPAERLDDRLPGRPRSYLALANHLVAIAEGYLEVAAGADFDGRIAAAVPEAERSPTELRAAVERLCRALPATPTDVARDVATYYGPQPLHAVLERCTWHCAQHARQLMMVLDGLGIAADGPLGAADFVGLPMPTEVWD